MRSKILFFMIILFTSSTKNIKNTLNIDICDCLCTDNEQISFIEEKIKDRCNAIFIQNDMTKPLSIHFNCDRNNYTNLEYKHILRALINEFKNISLKNHDALIKYINSTQKTNFNARSCTISAYIKKTSEFNIISDFYIDLRFLENITEEILKFNNFLCKKYNSKYKDTCITNRIKAYDRNTNMNIELIKFNRDLKILRGSIESIKIRKVITCFSLFNLRIRKNRGVNSVKRIAKEVESLHETMKDQIEIFYENFFLAIDDILCINGKILKLGELRSYYNAKEIYKIFIRNSRLNAI